MEENCDSNNCGFYIKVQQPLFEVCPKPSKDLQSWLPLGWEEYSQEEVRPFDKKIIPNKGLVYFDNRQFT